MPDVYKRQEYLYLKANPNADFVPKTYIFGAKAAPGYYMAKQMIRMICKPVSYTHLDVYKRQELGGRSEELGVLSIRN